MTAASFLFRFTWLLLMTAPCPSAHKCIHDQLDPPDPLPGNVVHYEGHPYAGADELGAGQNDRSLASRDSVDPHSGSPEIAKFNHDHDHDHDHGDHRRRRAPHSLAHRHGRGLAESGASLAPLRLRFRFADESNFAIGGGAELRSYLANDLLPKAASYWSQALSVVPVASPMKFPRCSSFWPDGSCAGIRNIPLKCGRVSVPLDVIGAVNYCTIQPGQGCKTSSPAGAGVTDADMVIFVTVEATSSCSSTGPEGSATIAYASYCQTDQFDRPVFGTINFCPSTKLLSTGKTALTKQSFYSTALHEIAHALGFPSGAWPFFRDPSKNGEPRTTPRATAVNPLKTGQPKQSFKFQCGGVERTSFSVKGTVTAERGPASFDAATGTIVYDATQVDDATSCPVDPPKPLFVAAPPCQYGLSTPAVLATGRKYFNCQSLKRVPLENQPTAECNIVGSHWEQRALHGELMASTTTGLGADFFISPMTLAAFEDSGWYAANYSMAVPRVDPPISWGRGTGCDFLRRPCLHQQPPSGSDTLGAAISVDLTSSTSAPQHFCTAPAKRGCSLNRLSKAVCNINSYTADLPKWFQYFSSKADIGGGLAEADFCPYMESYSNQYCPDPAGQPSTNYQGEVYGKTRSRCFESTLNQVISSRKASKPSTACYDHACFRVSGDSRSYLQIIARDKHGHARAVTCSPADSGKTKTMTCFTEGTITCPDVAAWCPTSGARTVCSTPPVPQSTANAPCGAGVASAADDGLSGCVFSAEPSTYSGGTGGGITGAGTGTTTGTTTGTETVPKDPGTSTGGGNSAAGSGSGTGNQAGTTGGSSTGSQSAAAGIPYWVIAVAGGFGGTLLLGALTGCLAYRHCRNSKDVEPASRHRGQPRAGAGARGAYVADESVPVAQVVSDVELAAYQQSGGPGSGGQQAGAVRSNTNNNRHMSYAV